MRRAALLGAFVAVAFVAFVAGQILHVPRPGAATGSRRILYWVDPMHPSYRANQPGTAPDCGMPLEPVYEGDDPAANLQLPPGAVAVSAERQHLIGVQVETVEPGGGHRHVRTTGKVQADANRTYVLTAGAAGWVVELGTCPEGTLVKKDELMSTYFSREFRATQAAYLSALAGSDFRKGGVRDSGDAPLPSEVSLKLSEEQLRSLGMSDRQVRELSRTRQLTNDIQVASPADGLVLSRNLSPEQRFDRGTELYRIADLSHVWIVADLFGDEARDLRPGTPVEVTVRELGRKVRATVGRTPPTFDPVSRTLKLRLEAPNPGMVLRPDMYVDLEFELNTISGSTVPADAILDSGMRRIVYVETSPGVFEPRRVETGETYGDRVAVRKGLSPGDRVVTSGTFLLDSESRMRTSSGGGEDASAPARHRHAPDGRPTDLVCGMAVDSVKAVANGFTIRHGGTTYVFCSEACRKKFAADPDEYTDPDAEGAPAVPARADMPR